MKKRCVTKFRKALQEFLWAKFQYRFEKGDYDKAIELFLDARGRDVCTFYIKINLIPNDIMVMRLLSGAGLDAQLMKAVRTLWDKERRKK